MNALGANKAGHLIAAANELLALASRLEAGERSPEARGNEDSSGSGVSALPEHASLWAELARQLYRKRKDRIKVFGNEEFFGEPAWDIMLYLFIASNDLRRPTITDTCAAACVPTTTARRWLWRLEELGFIVREDDPTDSRRKYLRLSASAHAGMVEYFHKEAGFARPIETTEHQGWRGSVKRAYG